VAKDGSARRSAAPSHPLFTIGYEGAAPEEVIARLKDAGVAVLIDVRDAPVSRKPGFSKNALAAALTGAGIDYVHFRWLGNPKPGRNAGRAGDIATYHKIYFARLETPEAEAALAEVGAIAARRPACLLCYERDPEFCHRTIVAGRLADRHGFAIDPLYATRPAE
jgi:uncharacterized protein (DUF488 family)